MKLKEYPEKNEITQAELAEKVGCSLGMASRVLRGVLPEILEVFVCYSSSPPRK